MTLLRARARARGRKSQPKPTRGPAKQVLVALRQYFTDEHGDLSLKRLHEVRKQRTGREAFSPARSEISRVRPFLWQAFARVDKDKSLTIDSEELFALLKEINEKYTMADAEGFIGFYDGLTTEKDKTMQFSEFVRAIQGDVALY